MGKIRQLVNKVWDRIGGDALWHLITEVKRYFLGHRGVWHVLTFIAGGVTSGYYAFQAWINSWPSYFVVPFFLVIFACVLAIVHFLWMLWDKWQQRHLSTQAKTHPTLQSKNKEITKPSESKIDCEIYGIPFALRIKNRVLFFLPEVTIANGSTRTVSIGVELQVPIGSSNIACLPPESTPGKEWEHPPQSIGYQRLTFPLKLPARKTIEGSIAFDTDRLKGLANIPDFKNCEVQFTNLHTEQLIHSEAIIFIINI
jgi:hypothetical protein